MHCCIFVYIIQEAQNSSIEYLHPTSLSALAVRGYLLLLCRAVACHGHAVVRVHAAKIFCSRVLDHFSRKLLVDTFVLLFIVVQLTGTYLIF